MQGRETLGSRLGFILIAAGCAIGLGNVWRFPFITGENGGAAFVVIYLIFLAIRGFTIMMMEFSMGRASQRNLAGALRILQPKKTGKWQLIGFGGIAGNLILMMFYTTVAGWGWAYLFHTAKGDFNGLTPDQVGAAFGGFLGNTGEQIGWMALVIVLGFLVCSLGLRRGVERISKVLMSGLFVLMIVLIVRSVTLPGAAEGLNFYLNPDFSKLTWDAVFAAMGQAFFTLSLGIGSMTIFGSYLGKDRSLTGETAWVIGLDTLVAIMAGLNYLPRQLCLRH